MSLSTCPLTASRSADCSTLRGRGQKSRGHRSLSPCVEQPADECMQIGEGDGSGSSRLVAWYCVTIHSFADDRKFYLHCTRNDTMMTIARLEQCIVDINYWMSTNHLKLNMDKTELLCAGTRRSLSMGDDSFPSLQLGGAIIAPSQHVRVLGVIFSADLSIEKHVSNVSTTCFHRLRRLRHIRRLLTSESATTLVHTFVTSRVDCCLRWGSKDNHQQVAMSVELGSSCSQWYTEVRPRSQAADAY